MGGFNKKTIKDISLQGKRVLLRADYNVPLVDGRVSEDYRLQASLPTIKYLLEQKVNGLIIISHLGRPDGKPDRSLSLGPVAKRLGELLGRKIQFADDCVGEVVKQAVDQLKPGDILLLENLRFHPGEEADDPDFAKALVEAASAEIFVQDGFGVVHRAHASTDAITKLLPSVAGLLLEREVGTLEKVMAGPARPLTAVIGGAKIADKIDVLKKFIGLADNVAVAGAMANNFLLTEGHGVGRSIIDKSSAGLTKEILALARAAEATRPFNFIVPVDGVVSTLTDGRAPTRVVDFSNSLADIETYPKRPKPASYTVAADELILDIGPLSAQRIAGTVTASRTVIWNGTAGVTETRGLSSAIGPFSHGTRVIVEAIIGTSRNHKNRPFSVVGGGDTTSYIEQQKLLDDFNFVSTGGGASLELLAGHILSGIRALQDK